MINWILSSSILIILVILIRSLFKGRIKLKVQYALWLVLLVRLLVPIQIGSSQLSVSNYVEPIETRLETVQNVPLFEGNANVDISEKTENTTEENTAARPQKSDRQFDVVDALLFVWIAGAAVTALSIILSNLVFCLRLHRSRRKLNVKCSLPVYECLWLDTPCLFGLIKPSIYINKHGEGREVKYVLCHELMHFRQGDHIWAAFRSLCLVLHWYNPLVWLAAALSKQDGELSCDEAVIKTLGESERFEYGKTLVFMSCKGRTPLLNMATSMKGGKSSLAERIGIIASKPKMKIITLIVIIVLTAFAVGCTFTGKNALPADEVESPVSQEDIAEEETYEVSVSVRVGKFFDRNGLTFEPDNYEGLAGSSEAFAVYREEYGADVYLTIDSRLQEEAELLLANTLAEIGDGTAGAIVAVNVNTGEPLAIVSQGAEKNLALEGVYEPGNLFLPVTAITAIGHGIIEPDYVIDCQGVFDRYKDHGYAPQCEKFANVPHNGAQTLQSALENGCQYYFYVLANDCGIDSVEEYARALGLGEWPGIDLDYAPGFLANRMMYESWSQWRIADTIEAAVGRHGSAFTPIQYAEYCAALANGGSRYHADLIYKIEDRISSSTYTREVTVNTYANIGTEGYNAIRQAMYNIGNVNNSALRSWATGQWPVSGMANGEPGISDRLYMGFAPFDKPEIAVAVVIEDTQVEYAAEKLAREVVLAYENNIK